VGFVIGLVLAHHQQLNLIQIQQFGTKNIYIHLAASQNGGACCNPDDEEK
jgi:hypothetical protein